MSYGGHISIYRDFLNSYVYFTLVCFLTITCNVLFILICFIHISYPHFITKWRADWCCWSKTSISFGLGQYAWPSRMWGPSIGWCCHYIIVLASLFHACPRPCPPVDLFAVSHVSCHAQKWQLSLLYRFKQRHFGTCNTNHFSFVMSLVQRIRSIALLIMTYQ